MIRSRTRVVVVGAGAFGGWSALTLLRRGIEVTLIDAWGPGNSRASSGGETRVIRATYGRDRLFTEMAARSLELWRDAETRWNRRFSVPTGMLWLAGKDDVDEKEALKALSESGVHHEAISADEAQARYPQVSFESVEWCIFERDAGYILARRACERILETFLEEGGEYRQLDAKPGPCKSAEMESLQLSDGSTIQADQYVFACGPWLGLLFPDVVGKLITPTRQEVFFFGTPAGDDRFLEGRLPVWLDNRAPVFYGIPGNERRGLKIACDSKGIEFDPTSGERLASGEGAAAARDYLEMRFPSLRGAPLVESRVCQYENSPDRYFIIDRHPAAQNVVLAGGGSGHGFKHGPAVGERVAKLVVDQQAVEQRFSIKRFAE